MLPLESLTMSSPDCGCLNAKDTKDIPLTFMIIYHSVHESTGSLGDPCSACAGNKDIQLTFMIIYHSVHPWTGSLGILVQHVLEVNTFH